MNNFGCREIDYQLAFLVHDSRYIMEHELTSLSSKVRCDVYDKKSDVLIELKNSDKWYAGIGQLYYYRKLSPLSSMCLGIVDEQLALDKIELLTDLDISYLLLPAIQPLATYAALARDIRQKQKRATFDSILRQVKAEVGKPLPILKYKPKY